MSPTDELLRKVESLRSVLDNTQGRMGVQIRAVLERGTITDVKASVKAYEERGR